MFRKTTTQSRSTIPTKIRLLQSQRLERAFSRAAGRQEHEAGVSVADLCRKHGVSDASIYKWKAKFGGMDVSEAKRLRSLEDENAKLKRLLADAMLDNAALKDLLGKKW